MRPARDAVLGLFRVLGPSGMMSYLTYMAERLEEMKRLLRPTGSIFLHCDPTANSYLRVLLDGILGARTLRNEIVWCYTGPGSPGMRQFNRKHDTIYWYSIGERWSFNADAVREAHHPKTRGNFKKGLWGSGFVEGQYGLARGGKVPETWWAQRKGNGLAIAARQGKQYLGYQTQKPLALLERIVKAASNKGDMVLDPFCGCGTAVDAANRLGREWAGVDISSFAIDLICKRRLIGVDVTTKGIPYDLASARKLAADQPFNFESWAVTRLAGFAPNTQQVGDGGVDGRATLAVKPVDHPSRLALAQVKGGKFSLSHLRDFLRVQDRDKAALGVYVTLDPVTSRAAKVEAGKARTVTVGAEQYPRCQLWPIGTTSTIGGPTCQP